MSAFLNRVTLIGNLGQDPESRSFQSGGKVVRFSLATNESWNDRQTGERRERVEWHRVSVLNPGLATLAEEYLRRGAKVLVEGQLRTSKFTDREGGGAVFHRGGVVRLRCAHGVPRQPP